MTIKYIFFDMDGTLIDSMKVHFISWQKALKKYAIEVLDDELKMYGGMSFVDTIKIFGEKYNKNFDDKQILDIRELKIKYLFEIFEKEVIVYPDVVKGLNNLKKKDFKLVLVSGAIRKTVDLAVNLFFKDIFDYIITQDDVINCKPNPEPYLKARDYFKANSNECLVVEDAIAGIKSGKSAEMKVFALITTMRIEELFLAGADEVFESHQDLFNKILSL